ncbi:MAG: hypothetical protein QOC99_2873 [Acidobacteriota bacterium]|jgi:hypothetical protein|nr:hypothetical protein [Acidobacteriota bacterium]
MLSCKVDALFPFRFEEMKTVWRTRLLRTTMTLGFVLFGSVFVSAQNAPPSASCQPSPTPITKTETAAAASDAGGIRIFLYGADKKPLARKRFFLLQRSAFSTEGINWASMPKRADFLQGASPQLREWLARHDCDSLYCPEFESEFPEAVKTVPEFKRAFDEGLRKYHNEKLAMKWLAVNFPLKNVRSEYFKRKKAWLVQAEQKTGRVVSFMTDEKGRAVFTGFKMGDYYISNLFPLQEGGPVWDCKVMSLPPNPRQMWAVTYVLSQPAAQTAASSP